MAVILSFLVTVSCPALNAPLDGRKFGSKYLVDHEVHFTCNPGFRLVGPSSVVCLPNGTWTGEQPRCKGTVPPPQPPGLDPSKPSRGPLGRKGHFVGHFLPDSSTIRQLRPMCLMTHLHTRPGLASICMSSLNLPNNLVLLCIWGN